MALVPFSVSGAAASQDLQERLMQVGPFSLLLRQRPGASGNTAHLTADPTARHTADRSHPPASATPAAAASVDQQQQQGQQQQQQPDLSNVGLVLWQSGFVLADFLLLRLQAAGGAVGSSRGGIAGSSSGSWVGVRVLELGCGGGTVGMFLALAGAQVVLTDQDHILPLTKENLVLNFPATAAAAAAPHFAAAAAVSHSNQQQGRPFGSGPSQQHPLPVQAQAPSAAAGALAVGAGQQQPARDNGTTQHLSAADAFAAAFGASTASAVAQQEEQQHASDTTASAATRLFSTGPLVVPYSWGEPLQLLHDRLSAAAAARLAPCPAAGDGLDHTTQPQGPASNAAGASPDTPQQQLQGLDHEGGFLQQWAEQGYDIVVGADLLYDPAHHVALLQSLQQLAAASPHLQVFLCWRCRALGEEAFLEAAAAAGWVTEEVPAFLLHPEFQMGLYKLVRMVRLP